MERDAKRTENLDRATVNTLPQSILPQTPPQRFNQWSTTDLIKREFQLRILIDEQNAKLMQITAVARMLKQKENDLRYPPMSNNLTRLQVTC